MTFDEKSTLTVTLLLVVEYTAYFAAALGPVSASPDRQAAFTGLVIGATVVFATLAVVTHVVLALAFRRQIGTGRDERHRLASLRGHQLGGHVLAVGVFAGIVLAVLQVEAFWIAQTLIAAWVLAEISQGAATLLLGRRQARTAQHGDGGVLRTRTAPQP